jgi:hypothetical protein
MLIICRSVGYSGDLVDQRTLRNAISLAQAAPMFR